MQGLADPGPSADRNWLSDAIPSATRADACGGHYILAVSADNLSPKVEHDTETAPKTLFLEPKAGLADVAKARRRQSL